MYVLSESRSELEEPLYPRPPATAAAPRPSQRLAAARVLLLLPRDEHMINTTYLLTLCVTYIAAPEPGMLPSLLLLRQFALFRAHRRALRA